MKTKKKGNTNRWSQEGDRLNHRRERQQEDHMVLKPHDEFIVHVVDKWDHPWEHRITETDKAFAINGIKGSTLHLHRGHTYNFSVRQEPTGWAQTNNWNQTEESPNFTHFFYFTKDPLGGPKGVDADNPTYDPVPLEGTPQPWGNGKGFLKITREFPQYFYYQCRNYRYMGGLIIVHD